jgi:UDPglucose 6-dehydrogenase
MRQKVGIVGYGYVGRAMYNFFKKHYDVFVHDVQDVKDVPIVERDEINSCDLSLICVPTPMGSNGRCDTSLVDEVVSWLKTPITIIKSTVEVGTTAALSKLHNKNLVFSPEYCGESSYWSPYLWDRDVKETPFFIFGGSPECTSRCVDFYLPVAGPVKKYIQTSSCAAEMAKYMENSFYATKIAFCYEMAEICQAAGIDYNTVRELWLNDPRINPMHTAVFEKNDSAFGGKCLPKDLSALHNFAKSQLNYEPKLLGEVLESNNRIGKIRKTRRDK